MSYFIYGHRYFPTSFMSTKGNDSYIHHITNQCSLNKKTGYNLRR